MANIKKIGNIAKGTAKFVLGINDELRINRIAVCKECPISKNAKGKYSNWCRSMNGGCGCNLNLKASEEDEYCPYGAWVDKNIFLDKVPKTINPDLSTLYFRKP